MKKGGSSKSSTSNTIITEQDGSIAKEPLID
jgi:hypothetical protein